MVGTKTEGLFVTKILKKAYHGMFKGQGKFVRTSESSEIADNSDWHKTRIWTMHYRGSRVLNINGQSWVIAYGSTGDFPIKKVYGDIIAVPSDNPKDIGKNTGYFSHSMILAGHNGAFRFPPEKSVFYQPMVEVLNRIKINDFITQKVKRDGEDGCFDPETFEAAVREHFLFKPELANVLAVGLEKVLRDVNPKRLRRLL